MIILQIFMTTKNPKGRLLVTVLTHSLHSDIDFCLKMKPLLFEITIKRCEILFFVFVDTEEERTFID